MLSHCDSMKHDRKDKKKVFRQTNLCVLLLPTTPPPISVSLLYNFIMKATILFRNYLL